MVIALTGWTGLRPTPAAGLSIAAGQREYLIKAAFIYDLIKATQWPKARPEQVMLCSLGRDPFGQAWQSIAGKPVGSRKVQIAPVKTHAQFSGCDVLFVGTSERTRWSRIRADLAARPILTVSEMTGFSRDGGMVTLMNVENRLRFDVNLRAVHEAGLVINTDALEQASAVHASASKVRWP